MEILTTLDIFYKIKAFRTEQDIDFYEYLSDIITFNIKIRSLQYLIKMADTKASSFILKELEDYEKVTNKISPKFFQRDIQQQGYKIVLIQVPQNVNSPNSIFLTH